MKWIWITLWALAAVIAIVAAIGALLPERHTVTRTSHFHQRPQQIWDVIAGPLMWRPDIKSFKNLPPRSGHRTWKEIDAHDRSVTYEAIEEATPLHLITRIADPNLPTAESGCTRSLSTQREAARSGSPKRPRCTMPYFASFRGSSSRCTRNAETRRINGTRASVPGGFRPKNLHGESLA